jgi:thermitase
MTGNQGRFALRRAMMALVMLGSVSAMASSEPEAVPGEYVVKLKSGLRTMNVRTLSQQLGSYVKSTIPNQNIVVIKRPVFEVSSSVVKTLAQNPMVDIVEPNYIYRISKTPNDPKLGELWGMKNIGQKDSSGALGTAGIDVEAEKAWDIETGNRDLVVAVIDTGVDFNNEDLKENIWRNEAELSGQANVDDDNNGYIDDVYGWDFANNKANGLDDHGHGTHCAGTIGAKGDDGKGIVGVAWNVKIMPVKFLSADGGGSLESALLAIDYATKMGAKVLSNSWGGGGASDTLKEAIERSHAAGALFVAAAGNNGTNNDQTPTYPANYDVPNVLSVAAIDNKGKLAGFSCFGKATVHVGAPGVNILSTTTSGYDSWSGTSMATPHVSGIAALIASHEPNLTNVEIKERIISTARPIAGLKNKVKSGGLASAYLALTNQQAPPDPNDPSRWASQALNISSSHPYKDKSKETFDVSIPGAKQIALYFSKFDTERGYDKLKIFDSAGKLVAEMSGGNDDSWSPIIDGSSAKLEFSSDDSVTRYGFDLVKAGYR